MNTKKTKKNANITITVKLLNITDPADAYKLFAIAKFDNMRDAEKDIISKTIIPPPRCEKSSIINKCF